MAKGCDLGRRGSRNLTSGLQWVFSSQIIVFLCCPDQTLDPSALSQSLNQPLAHTPLKPKRGREVLHPESTVSQTKQKKICVCVCVCVGFKHKPAVELTLSQCGPRAAHTRQELVGKNTKLQLVQEGLSERPPWSLILAGGPDPKVEIVYLKGQPRGIRGPSPGGQGMGVTGWMVQHLAGLLETRT